MKKRLICMAASAVMIFASLTSYAATYETSKEVSTDQAQDMKTVLIYKGAAEDSATRKNIVYIDEATGTFDAATKFIIKSLAAAEGYYTVRFSDGQGGAVVTDEFYIGMSEAAGDLPMTRIRGLQGNNIVTEEGKEPYYNLGYTVTADLADYHSIIIKTKDGTYMGLSLPIEGLTGTGTAVYGIQINGAESTDSIKGVWLSKRVITSGETIRDNSNTDTPTE